jgi:asparagine synthase (glutamine-hydrolysing)
MGTAHPLSKTSDLTVKLFRIKDHAESVVSDDAFAKGGERWADAPSTKEAYFIRQLFDGNSVHHLQRQPSQFTTLIEFFPSEAAASTAVR